MDKMKVVKQAQQLLMQHGVKNSACVNGSVWEPADGYVLDMTGASMEQADEMLRTAAGRSVPVAVVTGNAGNTELAMAALSGADSYQLLYDACARPVFTAESLDALCEKHGFFWKDAVSCGEALSQTADANPLHAKETSVGWAVRQIVQQRPSAKETHLIRLYLPGEGMLTQEKPFLSVIIRTQGTRIASLREGLLCLMAQTDQSFEILLVAHKAEPDKITLLQQTIDEEPEFIRDRIRLLTCNTGKRTAPLNMALSHARGDYFAIFDDDDLLFDNWVEAFHAAARENPGRILHQYCVSQLWETFEKEGKVCTMAAGSLNYRYCGDFRLARQMMHNNCPPMGLAFPTALYSRLGFGFDATLDVFEDWEYLMRTVSFSGLAEADGVIGAVYRDWKNVVNSARLFDKDYWKATEQRIYALMDQYPVVLPEGGAKELRDLYVSAGGKEEIFDTALYVDSGDGFREESVIRQPVFMRGDSLVCEYDAAGMAKGKLQRWDPASKGTFVLWDLNIIGRDEQGTETILPVQRCNGTEREGRYAFDGDDPQLYFVSPMKALKAIKIECRVRWRFSSEEMDEVRSVRDDQARTMQEQARAMQEQARTTQKQICAMQEQARAMQEQARAMQEQARTTQKQLCIMQEQARATQEQICVMQKQAEHDRQEHQAELAQRDQEIGILHSRLAERSQTVEVLNQQIQSYIHSTSWKVTRPLRGVKKVLRKTLGFDKAPEHASLLVRGVRYYRKNGLKGLLLRLMKGSKGNPGAVQTLQGAKDNPGAAQTATVAPPTSMLGALSRHEGLICDEAALRQCLETEKPYSYRVLFVSHEMSLTGAPLVLLNFAKAVLASGHQAVFITPVDGPLRKEAEKARIPVVVVPDLFAAKDILDIAYPFNAVVANTIASAAFVRALNGTDIPVLWWIHEAKVSYHPGALLDMPEKLENNVHVYSVCEYARNMLSQYRPDYQSELLPYCMDDFANVEGSATFSLPPHKGKTVFTLVGAMEERKGQDVLVQAIRLLPKKVRDQCLFVIVAKKYHKPFEKMIDQLCADYPQNVLYYEQLGRDDIANLYRESNCQICASRDDPLPCVITEALAVGKPAICSENTGYASILSEMRSGIVYENDSPQLLARAIERYMAKPKLQKELAGNARRTYEKYFTCEAFAEHANMILNRHVLKLLPEEANNPELRGKTLRETMELTSPVKATVSVVIPTWNPGASYESLLNMLEQQQGVDKLEIVIVDSGSKDDTIKISKEHGVKLIQIPNEEFSHSGARNMGAKAASGDILLFMTQDAFPASKDWVRRLIEPILHKNVAAVSPMEKCPPDTDLYYRVASSIHSDYLSNNREDKLNEGMGNGDRIVFRARSGLNDVTTAINRRIFMRFLYRHDFAEDLDMGMRLIRSGYRLMMMSSVQTIHGHNRAAGYYFKRTLVDTVTTSETILQMPVRGTARQTDLAEMLGQGWGAMQYVYQQVLRESHPDLPSFERAIDKAFAAADRLKAEEMRHADGCKELEDPVLTEVVDILRQHCVEQDVPRREVISAMRGYWQNLLLPFAQKEGKWNAQSAQEMLECINKHLASTLGCELARLSPTDEAYAQLRKFTAGV